MNHQHIKYKNRRWKATVWECECGFKTTILSEFNAHLQETSNKPVDPTATKMQCKSIFRHESGSLHCMHELGHVGLHRWEFNGPVKDATVWGEEKRLQQAIRADRE